MNSSSVTSESFAVLYRRGMLCAIFGLLPGLGSAIVGCVSGPYVGEDPAFKQIMFLMYASSALTFAILSSGCLHKMVTARLSTIIERWELRLNDGRHCRLDALAGDDELAELDRLLSQTYLQWSALVERDSSLFENLAVQTERQRIDRDIERLIGQHLLRIREFADRCSDDSLKQQTNETISFIRDGVNGVMSEHYPRLLAEAGLVQSIKALLERFKRASSIETAISIDSPTDDIDLPLDAKFTIYRVIQEALNNIEKHSHATRARITAKALGDDLEVLIEDNGTGFEERKSVQSRGLKIIRERARSIGADVKWQKSISFRTGTAVTILLRTAAAQDDPSSSLG